MPQNIKARLIEAEVYSRVVGYYRPVQNWNPGKKQEFKDRQFQTFQKEEKMGTCKVIKRGVHRPMTMGLQLALGKKDGGYLGPKADGFFGEETEAALGVYQEQNNLERTCILDADTFAVVKEDIPFEYLLFELIACFETGLVKNSWGYAGDCGDGNGMNYGPMQLNRAKGSVQTFEKYYMPRNECFESYYSTPEGAEAQARYYLDIQIARANRDFNEIFPDVVMTPRMIGLLVDGAIQGGAPFPSHPARNESLDVNWPDGEEFEKWRTQIKVNYKGIGYYDTPKVKVAFIESLAQARDLGIDAAVAYSELHPRSGIFIHLGDQLSRRRLWTTGKGIVHDDPYDLSDFGI
jgi:hypothetical protein